MPLRAKLEPGVMASPLVGSTKVQDAPAEVFRRQEGLGVWPGRGKVACVGVGMGDCMRRWGREDDISLSVGNLMRNAIQHALDEAGISKEDVDGIAMDPTSMSSYLYPPYLAPPFDSEDGLSFLTAEWLIKNVPLPNVQFATYAPGCISFALNAGAQAVFSGQTHTCLVLRGLGNPPGRYEQTPVTSFGGRGQWPSPWDWRLIPLEAYCFNAYCRKYNTIHDRLYPFIANERRNGSMQPWGYFSQHRPEHLKLTREEYLSSRWICKPMCLHDADMPIQTAGAFLFTTAERAKNMKQKPVYILNHCSQIGVPRSSTPTLEEYQGYADRIARMCYEGSGLSGPDELDVFNPYEGYITFFQYYLEAFGWRGVKHGEAHDFYEGDISVEGPNPLSPGGGNNGNGRTRWWNHLDCVQQLQGNAGKRAIKTRCETGVSGAFTPGRSDWIVWGTENTL